MLTSIAFHDPKGLDGRRKELRAKLKHDTTAPIKPQWTKQEMQEAAQRLMAGVLKTGKIIS